MAIAVVCGRYNYNTWKTVRKITKTKVVLKISFRCLSVVFPTRFYKSDFQVDSAFFSRLTVHSCPRCPINNLGGRTSMSKTIIRRENRYCTKKTQKKLPVFLHFCRSSRHRYFEGNPNINFFLGLTKGWITKIS